MHLSSSHLVDDLQKYLLLTVCLMLAEGKLHVATLVIHSLHRNYTHTHTHPFNGPFSRTTRVGRYQKGKTNLDFTEARETVSGSGISWAI